MRVSFFESCETPTGTPNLLRNASLEQAQTGQLTDWSRAPKGFGIAAGEGRTGSVALGCEATDEGGWYGASQTLTLNRSTTAPLLIRGWSKAQNVTGGTDSGYSLYVDLV